MNGQEMLRVIRRAVRPGVIGLKSWIFRLLPYRPDEIAREVLDDQYRAGRFDYYRGVSELPRYSIILGYCDYFKSSGTILDIGCGEGILQERLNLDKYFRYVGIDLSAEAIRKASHKQSERISFVAGDASAYDPQEKFDIIIFGDCLVHFKDPLSILKRYEKFLKDDGIFIVSIFVHGRTMPMWKILEAAYTPVDAVRVSHMTRLSWIVKVFIPSHQKG